MFPFFETIMIADSVPCNLKWHQARVERTLKYHYGSCELPPLEDIIPALIINIAGSAMDLQTGGVASGGMGIAKCRFRYNNGEWATEFEPYRPRAVNRLHLVRDNEIDYSFKFSDRCAIEKLFNERETADDVLIVRNGMITDTSIANIVFTDGLRFYTPDTPLLRGTCREQLISEGIISEVPVHVGNLDKYTHFMLINAMNPFDRERLLPVKNIV